MHTPQAYLGGKAQDEPLRFPNVVQIVFVPLLSNRTIVSLCVTIIFIHLKWSPLV